MGGRLFIVPRRKGTSKPSSFFALRALTTKPRLEAIRRLSSRKKVIEDRLSNTLSLVSAGRNDGGCLVRILARSIRKRVSLRFLRGLPRRIAVRIGPRFGDECAKHPASGA